MKTKFTSLAVLAALLTSPVFAKAEDVAPKFEISSNIGFFSEYVFRGISQSDESFSVQGGFDIGHSSGLYAGIWGSNVDFNDGDEANLEIDLYGGYSGSINSINYDIGLIYYAYPGAESSLNYDFWESYVGLGYDWDFISANASLNYSPDYFGDSGDAFYTSVNADVPLPADFTLSAHVGYQTIEENENFGPNYADWSLGLGYAWEGFDFSVNYIDTDLNEPNDCSDGCDPRIVLGVSRQF